MDLSVAREWVELALRWAHLVFGAAWIGTSFYFNWLNHSMRPPDAGEDGVGGELWAVHGGEFFRVAKYRTAPAVLPRTLHWFKWEAYLTWITGLSLLLLVYYFSDGFLLDPLAPLDEALTIGIALGSLVVAWLMYDLLCRSPIGRMPVPFAVLGLALGVGAAYGFSWLLAPRAAYIHVGAIIGTIMAANVFMIIIPYQRKSVSALQAGREPDIKHIHGAAQRSLHNNYLTLPVLYIMVSNHYPFTFGHEYNWAILAAISVIGAGVRHYFNLKNRGRNAVWILPAAAVAMMALAFVSAPRSDYEDVPPPAFEEVRTIIEARCVACHSASPTHEIYREAPQGIAFDTPAEIEQYAGRIHNQVVVSKVMPLGNMTNMTDEERHVIGAWFYHLAR